MPDVRTSIKERVGGYCGANDVTKRWIAEHMDMAYSTFYSKLNGPSEFTFSEGVALAELLGIGPDELAGIHDGNTD